MIDSKHLSISQTISDSTMEAINTITALWLNSLRDGQLVLCTSSLYDSFTLSTNFIYSRFFLFIILIKSLYCFFDATLFRVNNLASAFAKVRLEAIFVTIARKAGIEPTLTVLETALLPLEDFRISLKSTSTKLVDLYKGINLISQSIW